MSSLHTMEFLAVDTETNGRGGDLCELTELGCVLVGGGELHEEWSSLVRVDKPLSRGIQRFTGISQGMVDSAPPPEEVLAEFAGLLGKRVLVAHNASFDRRVLKQAFARAGIEWPDPPVLCTLAMGRKFAPLARQRGLRLLAESLGITVEESHRALPDAVTCARIFCALFPKLCANAASLADAMRLLSPRRRPGSGGPRRTRIPREARPDLSKLPDDPGVYVFRDERGRPLYVGKSVAVRTRARSHFCAPADWTEKADVVDYKPTNSEVGALVLENRLIKEWRPPGNKALKRTDGWLYLRCRLDISYPVLEVASEPASGLAVNIGPLRGRDAAEDLAGELESLFQLRHCGRRMRLREHPSVYGQMDRCLSPCLGDLDPNAYRLRLDEALALFADGAAASERLLDILRWRMREAASACQFERAAVLRDRLDRLEGLLHRLGGVLQAVESGRRVGLARHPSKERWDAFWVAQGRVVDWGPLPPADEFVTRTRELADGPSRDPGPLPPDLVDEVRIVSSWLADPDAYVLELGPDCPDPAVWLEEVAGRASAAACAEAA